MSRGFQRAVLLVMAFTILYVLVSPLVPTPNALQKQGHSPALPVLFAFILYAMLLRAAAQYFHPVPRLGNLVPLIDITCSRLC